MRATITGAAIALLLAAVPNGEALPPPSPTPPPAYTINAHAMGTATPTVDGVVAAGEWPWAPQISITVSGLTGSAFLPAPVAPTYVIFASNATDLYVLVDAPGDTTVSSCDECLLAFDTDSTAPYLSAEIFGSTAFGTAAVLGGQAAMGYGRSQFDPDHDHRIYEFRIPLASLGVAPLQSVFFASPIDPAAPKNCAGFASMPYDGSTGNDNQWPIGLVVDQRGTWGVVVLAPDTAAVPALGGLGAVALIGLLTAAALLALTRRLG